MLQQWHGGNVVVGPGVVGAASLQPVITDVPHSTGAVEGGRHPHPSCTPIIPVVSPPTLFRS